MENTLLCAGCRWTVGIPHEFRIPDPQLTQLATTVPPNLCNMKALYLSAPLFSPSPTPTSRWIIHSKAAPQVSSTPWPTSCTSGEIHFSAAKFKDNYKPQVPWIISEDKHSLEFPDNPNLQDLCLPHHWCIQNKDHEFLLPRTRMWILNTRISNSHLCSFVSSHWISQYLFFSKLLSFKKIFNILYSSN